MNVRNTILSLLLIISYSALAQIPVGFTKIFNGKNLEGWHYSRSTHQGTTPNFSVEDGTIVARQNPFGQGGLLMTNKKYKDVELYVEVKIDSFANGGIFLRSNEGGAAYQIELAIPGGTGDLLGERIPVSVSAQATKLVQVWKPNDWNSFRIRMTGSIPHITLWINGTEMWNVKQTKNDFLGEEAEGMIALQCHWTAVYSPTAGKGMPMSSWRPGATHKYRNIAISDLTGK